MTTTSNISIVQGDHVTLNVTVLDSLGAVVDLTGYTLAARVGSITTENIGSGTVTVTDAANGELTIEYATAVTSLLMPNQNYHYQLRRTDSGAEATLLKGQISVINSLFV